ncbi:peptidoglycan DD-metalloendopeptidase family protein [Lipingzhangella sp. LS1_29]|uniref:Peptidoglycan DD-metalloendopeptidase family protein n=1 Tax=Lipingzhangella rawalii TaxID=2055835 RepID=A0ABU2H718_9ACTN|nr:peptidoglycan DD-metalloendopeptidase family protein [Lipingzhangella rawalii]MDS1270620.1 peptidoglycan DD-metalloendopeptidase family protein [Lipingzhangella rawalii]
MVKWSPILLRIRDRAAPRALTLVLSAVLILTPTRSAAESHTWVWPVPGDPEILRAFDPPQQPWLTGHRGVDLAASPGTAIRASGAGRVSYVGQVAETPVVAVTHGELRTTYLPVEAAAELNRGDRVAAGDQLGTLAAGPRHCPETNCLHWGLLRGRIYLDPLVLLGHGEVRLLPLPHGSAGVMPRATTVPDH